MTQLGDALSEERRRQGKSLVDIEAATRIRARMIEALEHGDYDQLPAAAYVKGYIQSYAKYLDIPVQPLLDMYKADVRFADERAAERMGPVMPRGARYAKASRQNLEDLPSDPVVPKREQAHAIPTRTWLMVGGGILLAFVLIWGVSRLAGGSDTPPPVPPSVEETSTVDPAAVVEDTTDASTSAEPSATTEPVPGDEASVSPAVDASVTPFKLTFRIHQGETSRLKITVDGSEVFNDTISEDNMPPEIKVYEKAVVQIGRPIWVTTLKDGKRVPTPNEEKTYTLTLENDAATQQQ
jgi:cytoskeletal protein RodZ